MKLVVVVWILMLHMAKAINLRAADFLYHEKTKYVTEIISADQFDKVKQNDQFLFIVFYAPWCPHCQHFAQPYINLAEKNIPHNIYFYALSCTLLGSICNANAVEAYPSVRAFHIPMTSPDHDKEKDDKGYSIGTPDVTILQAFIDRNKLVTLQNTSAVSIIHPLETSNSVLSSNSDTASSLVQDYITTRTHLLARVTSAYARLQDGLKSLDYILCTELYAVPYTHDVHKTVLKLLSTVIKLLPILLDERKYKYQQVYDILSAITHSSSQFSNVISSKVSEIMSENMRTLSGTVSNERMKTIQQEVMSILGYKNSLGQIQDIEWRVCGVRTDGTAGNNNYKSSVTQGYTCGLWLLFHYITVASEQRLKFDQKITSATKTKDTSSSSTSHHVFTSLMVIIRTIQYLFGCIECRSHFLAMVNSCRHDRVKLETSTSTYKDLQLWLFLSHDEVTRRIATEHLVTHNLHTSSDIKSSKGISNTTLQDTDWSTVSTTLTTVIWPPNDSCTGCRAPVNKIEGSTNTLDVQDNTDNTRYRKNIQETYTMIDDVIMTTVDSQPLTIESTKNTHSTHEITVCTHLNTESSSGSSSSSTQSTYWDDKAILTYLQTAYWDPTWTYHTTATTTTTTASISTSAILASSLSNTANKNIRNVFTNIHSALGNIHSHTTDTAHSPDNDDQIEGNNEKDGTNVENKSTLLTAISGTMFTPIVLLSFAFSIMVILFIIAVYCRIYRPKRKSFQQKYKSSMKKDTSVFPYGYDNTQSSPHQKYTNNSRNVTHYGIREYSDSIAVESDNKYNNLNISRRTNGKSITSSTGTYTSNSSSNGYHYSQSLTTDYDDNI